MGRARTRVLVASLTAALAAPLAAGAATVHPQGLPFAVSLPSGWTAGGASSQARFNATGPGGAHLAVTVGGSFPSNLPFSTFVNTETAAAKKAYRAEDPHAVVTASKLTLPAGPAVHISVTVSHGGAPVAIDLYSLLHKGVTYHFTYYTNKASLPAQQAGFTSSAKSIRWTS